MFGAVTIPLLRRPVLPNEGQLWDPLSSWLGCAAAAGLVVWLWQGQPGLRDLATRALRWRVPVLWPLAAAFALPALVMLVSLVLLWGETTAALRRDAGLAFALFVPELLYRLLLYQWAEEIGWMGLVQSTLQDRHGPWKATLLVTLPVALWHVPAWMVEFGHGWGEVHLALGVALLVGVVHLFARTVMLWVYNGTRRSVLVVALFHASFNTTVSPKGFGGLVPRDAVFVFATGLVVLAAIVLTLRTKGRLGRPMPS